MKTVKFYLEVKIPDQMEDITNLFKFVKNLQNGHYQVNDTRIEFTGGVKDFVTKDSPYLLGGPTEEQ